MKSTAKLITLAAQLLFPVGVQAAGSPAVDEAVRTAVSLARAAATRAEVREGEAWRAQLAAEQAAGSARNAASHAEVAAQQARVHSPGYAVKDLSTAAGNSNHYEGQVDGSGLPDGYGVMTSSGGSVYEGTFKRGSQDGEGVATWSRGDNTGEIYSGEVQASRWNGSGVYAWSTGPDAGLRYEGEFVSGAPNGVAVRYSGHGEHWGEFYAGEMRDWQMEGEGVYSWPSGKNFEGDFNNGVNTGYGVLSTSEGPNSGYEWVGHFLQGKLDGYGRILDRLGTVPLQGLFKSGEYTVPPGTLRTSSDFYSSVEECIPPNHGDRAVGGFGSEKPVPTGDAAVDRVALLEWNADDLLAQANFEGNVTRAQSESVEQKAQEAYDACDGLPDKYARCRMSTLLRLANVHSLRGASDSVIESDYRKYYAFILRARQVKGDDYFMEGVTYDPVTKKRMSIAGIDFWSNAAFPLDKLSELVERQGRHKEAEDLLRKAIAANEHNGGSYNFNTELYRMGVILANTGQYVDAERMLTRAGAWYMLGGNSPDPKKISDYAGLLGYIRSAKLHKYPSGYSCISEAARSVWIRRNDQTVALTSSDARKILIDAGWIFKAQLASAWAWSHAN